ncbi:putative WD40-repeat-containing domain superfamily [Helianthus annuus]|nr:putative WD40-repeat-containing domain superfamily [Helianthus annuus]
MQMESWKLFRGVSLLILTFGSYTVILPLLLLLSTSDSGSKECGSNSSLCRMTVGLLNLCGMHDLESKPVLLCSGNDNTVRAYDLPRKFSTPSFSKFGTPLDCGTTFAERGKIYAKQEIRSIHGGPNIFFTGDGTGEVRVWQWLADQSATTTPA